MAEQDGPAAGGRDEDDRLLRGRGTFVADLAPPGLLHAVVVRSNLAHGLLSGLRSDAARQHPGVVAVLTAADLAADGLPALPSGVGLKRQDGTAAPPAGRPLLAAGRVRHLGEALALVVAESHEAALDAAELVEAEIEELPVAPTLEAATEPAAPVLWPEAPDNVAFVWRQRDAAALAAAFAGARHVVRETFRISRVVPNPMEPRAVLAVPSAEGPPRLVVSHQAPFGLRDQLAKDLFGLEPAALRVEAPDVGGSFGMKLGVHPEDALVLWAARRLGRPVRWVCGRSEAFLADHHARDVRLQAALALGAELEFLALDLVCEVNVGAYLSGRALASIGNLGGIAGVYRTPLIGAELRGILTNSVPTGPYRGAGRPEATYAIERLIDVAARQVGLEPFELRRRNLIPPAAMPYRTALTFTYDCGDFPRNMELAAAAADLAGFPARRARALQEGRLRGLGVANCIEAAGGPFGAIRRDLARLTLEGDGSITLDSGVMSTGQGLETALARLVAERLGLEPGRVRFRQGDTSRLPYGRGSGGSSALITGGTAAGFAADRLVERLRRLAAEHFETALADVEYRAGRATVVGTDRSLSLAELAGLAAEEGGEAAAESAEFLPTAVTFPNGCHVCEAEVERDTGRVRLLNYVVVEDIGRVLFPQLAHGQLVGGIAQGLGQALGEAVVYDAESGQLLTGSFNDYAMPIAADMPPVQVISQPVPTALNPLGVKGVGEAGTVGSLAAVMNAVCDALAPLGIRHLDMPASPRRVWEAIRRAAAGGAGGS